jgi:hypothetical protein
MTDFAAAAQQLLAQALTQPAESIILGTVDAQGSIVLTVRADRVLDLVRVARSLIDDAIERTQRELDVAADENQDDDPVMERLILLMAALEEINTIDGMEDMNDAAQAIGPTPDGPPDLQARYAILAREVARERSDRDRLQADLHAAMEECAKLRQALGLKHDAPPAQARNFGGG